MLDMSHILTGTDFSDSSSGGVRESLRIASGDASRKITVVHVTKEIKDAEGLRERIREWISALPEYASLADPEAQITVDVEQGKISAGLARCAARVGATQVIVGPLPRTFTERYLTGAIAEQLFHSIRVPVLATRQPAEGGYAHILVPIDFSESSRRALSMASSLIRNTPGAVCDDAHLDLLHVASMPGGVRASHAGRELMESVIADFEAELHDFAREEGVFDLVDRFRAVTGVVQDIIPREAQECGADLICMASGSSRGILGSTVDAVLRNVTIPLLVSPPG